MIRFANVQVNITAAIKLNALIQLQSMRQFSSGRITLYPNIHCKHY